AGLLSGLVLGSRTALPADVQDAFRSAGVFHVLAVSGFNVALLAAAVWTVTRAAGGGRRAAAAAGIIAVLGFAAVVGPEPSVVRLAAQLAVLPVTLVHFNQVSTVGIIANLAAVPLAAGATVLGLLAVVAAAAADVAAAAVFGAVWPLLLLLRAVAALAAAVPGAVIHLPAPGPAAIVAYVGALGCGLVAGHQRAPRGRGAAPGRR